MRQRYQARNSITEGSRVYELAAPTDDTNEEDFASQAIPEN
jgi:hypothetical protein